jgi:hypothetical protein
MRGLWASVEVSPGLQRKLHWTMAILWFLFFFVILKFGWENSVPLLVFISVYANCVGHISSAQAAQVEVRQEAEEVRRDEEDNADLQKVEEKVDKIHREVVQ